MQATSNAQIEHLKHGGKVSVNIAVDPVSGDPFTLEAEDIREGTLKIDRNWSQGRILEIGCADTSELKFTLENGDGQWSGTRWEGARLTVNLHFGGGTLPAGVFTVDEPPRKLTTMQIRALDGMAKFNRPYITDLVFPATLLQVIQDACSKCNVTLHTLDFENKDYVVQEKPAGDDITFHLVVSWVAQLAGCNAWMDWLDQLRLSWYGDVQPGTIEIGPDDRYSYEAAETDITITGIMFRTAEADYIVGSDDYALVIEGNSLLQSNPEVVLSVLYNKIGGFVYRPFKFDTRGYPHLWPGDVITHLVDADGNQLTSIITNHSYTLNGKSQLAAKGETETVRGYATGAPFTSSQKRVLQSIARVETSRQLSDYERAALVLNQLMVNALGFYDTVIEQPSGAKIVYYHNLPSLVESSYIATLTELGYAWTNNGWNDGSPAWEYGVMSDGSMIIRLLTAVGINAEWIRTGLLIGGQVEFDLEKGTFRIGQDLFYDGQDLNFGQGVLRWDNLDDQSRENLKGESNYRVEILSANGNIFKNGQISTVLTARVYYGEQDVTDDLDAAQFRWTRVSSDTEGDEAWNTANFGGTKSVLIVAADVPGRATFNCQILREVN